MKLLRPLWSTAGILMLGCWSDPVVAPPDDAPPRTCTIPSNLILDGGVGVDGIPALTNPPLVPASPDIDYLLDDDRVIGFVLDGRPLAIPLNILWWHEIVNMDGASLKLAITHCPLTGSSIVFQRDIVDGLEFGVSGLLYLSNLIMYDRTPEAGGQSLWPQMALGARCGPRTETQLTEYPSIEMTWGGWRDLYPETLVVPTTTGFARDYTLYPYGEYDQLNDETLLVPLPMVDRRRPLKERVLGIPDHLGEGIAFPFQALDELGLRGALHLPDQSRVVFWHRLSASAAAFETTVDGEDLTFQVAADGFVDDQTGSTWRRDGLAVDGPLAGRRLPPVANAFVAFWFAWAAFYPETILWEGGEL